MHRNRLTVQREWAAKYYFLLRYRADFSRTAARRSEFRFAEYVNLAFAVDAWNCGMIRALCAHRNNRARPRLDRTSLGDSPLSFSYPAILAYVSISNAVEPFCLFRATSWTQCFRRSPASHRQRCQHDFHRQRGENNSHYPDKNGRALLPDDPQDDIGKTQENVGQQQHYQQDD